MTISTAVPAGTRKRTIGIQTQYQNLSGGSIRFLPQRVALIAQGNSASSYLTTPVQVFNRKDVGDLVGYGSPAERMAAALFPNNGDGIGIIPVTLYPLVDDGSGVVGTGNIAAVGTQTTQQTYYVRVNNIVSAAIVIPVTTDADTALGLLKIAINAKVEMPIIAGTVAAGSLPITSKWKGETANDIVIEIVGTEDGVNFTVTDPINGAANPDIQDALDLIVNTWETIIVPGYNFDDATTLNALQNWGDGRWGALIKKPLVALFAFTGTAAATGTAVTDARPSDKINVITAVPGSKELPFVLAARMAVRVAVLAQENPPYDYAGQKLTLMTAGADSDQFSATVENNNVTLGLGSVRRNADGVLEMSDTITCYHPAGEDPPAYAYVVDIMKIMNLLYNISLIFEADSWKGAPLVPDSTTVDASTGAKKPKDAKAAVFTLIDEAENKALIVDAEFAKNSVVTGISEVNPKRIDVSATFKISGNTGIISFDFNWGFFLGGV